MSCHSYEDLKRHIGHKIVVTCYGTEEERVENEPQNVAVECEDCSEVILSFDRNEKDYLGEIIAEIENREKASGCYAMTMHEVLELIRQKRDGVL